MKPTLTLLTALLLAPLSALHAAERATEVCVYGGTASGLLSAIAVAKSGRQVLVIEPSRWLGGMIGGGIRPLRDCAYPKDIGGLTKMILNEDERLGIEDKKLGNDHIHHGRDQIRAIWLRLMKEHHIEVIYEHRLKSVRKEGQRIVRVELENAPPKKDGCPAAHALPPHSLVTE